MSSLVVALNLMSPLMHVISRPTSSWFAFSLSLTPPHRTTEPVSCTPPPLLPSPQLGMKTFFRTAASPQEVSEIVSQSLIYPVRVYFVHFKSLQLLIV